MVTAHVARETEEIKWKVIDGMACDVEGAKVKAQKVLVGWCMRRKPWVMAGILLPLFLYSNVFSTNFVWQGYSVHNI